MYEFTCTDFEFTYMISWIRIHRYVFFTENRE